MECELQRFVENLLDVIDRSRSQTQEDYALAGPAK